MKRVYVLNMMIYEIGSDTPSHHSKSFDTYEEALKTAKIICKQSDVEWWDINEEEVAL